MADPLSVTCHDCLAPPETACTSSVPGATTHGTRARVADLRALEHGACSLCGRFMVRGSILDAPVDAWHPDPADAALCPELPDPSVDWNAYAKALNAGAVAGHPGLEHFLSNEVLEHAASIDHNEVPVPEDPDLNARIDAMHGPGAAAAIDAAYADGSIFGEGTS